jgi:serine/threonine-protein kinase RsbW
MASRREKILPSTPQCLHEVERFIEHVSDEFHLNNNYYGNILISVTEAVKNAIFHGNGEDPSKHISLVLEIRNEGLVFIITDQGKGFNFSEFEDLEKLIYDEKKGANGMVLIHTLSDEVRFLENGRKVELLFRVNGIDERILEIRYQLMQQYQRVWQRMQ